MKTTRGVNNGRNKKETHDRPCKNHPPRSHRRIHLETPGHQRLRILRLHGQSLVEDNITGKEGDSRSFFVRNADELQAVIQEAADWIESQQASLQESNDFKAQTILQKAA